MGLSRTQTLFAGCWQNRYLEFSLQDTEQKQQVIAGQVPPAVPSLPRSSPAVLRAVHGTLWQLDKMERKDSFVCS